MSVGALESRSRRRTGKTNCTSSPNISRNKPGRLEVQNCDFG